MINGFDPSQAALGVEEDLEHARFEFELQSFGARGGTCQCIAGDDAHTGCIGGVGYPGELCVVADNPPHSAGRDQFASGVG